MSRFQESFLFHVAITSCLSCFPLSNKTSYPESTAELRHEWVPPAPTDVTATPLNATATKVVWKPPKNGAWTFRVTCERTDVPFGDAPMISIVSETEDFSVVIAPLIPGGCYIVRVVTIVRYPADSEASKLYQSKPIEKNFTQRPAEPRKLHLFDEVMSTVFHVAWEESDGIVDAYELELRPDNHFLMCNTGKLAAMCTNLRPGTTYTVIVTARRKCNWLDKENFWSEQARLNVTTSTRTDPMTKNSGATSTSLRTTAATLTTTSSSGVLEISTILAPDELPMNNGAGHLSGFPAALRNLVNGSWCFLSRNVMLS